MPSRSSCRRTSAKCSRHPGHRWSTSFGRPAITGWSSGAFESSTRSGFVSVRRRLSSDSFDRLSRRLRAQPLHVLRPTARVSHRVEEQLVLRDAAGLEEAHGHLHDLDVHGRAGHPEGLDVHLVELPVAPLLRALAAEHRPQGIDLERGVRLHEVVLDDRAHDAGRGLGPEGQRGPLFVPILEGVHLLRDDVGVGADAAREQPRVLEEGRADLPIAVAARRGSARPPPCGARPPSPRAGCPGCRRSRGSPRPRFSAPLTPAASAPAARGPSPGGRSPCTRGSSGRSGAVLPALPR